MQHRGSIGQLHVTFRQRSYPASDTRAIPFSLIVSQAPRDSDALGQVEYEKIIRQSQVFERRSIRVYSDRCAIKTGSRDYLCNPFYILALRLFRVKTFLASERLMIVGLSWQQA